MSYSLRVIGLAFALGLAACSNSEDNNTNAQQQPLAACPDEKNLLNESLPCDCYGHEANQTTVEAKVTETACKTQVVCCPTISDMRCEDHEYCDDAGNCINPAVDAGPEAAVGEDAAPEAAAEAAVEDAAPEAAAVAKCPNEVNLATKVPCDCYGTVVTDVAVQYPDCVSPKKVVCCPGSKEPICE